MVKQQKLIFIISLTLLIGLHFADFYFNPQLLKTSCIQTMAQDSKVTTGKIYDCITCHDRSSHYFSDRFIGKYSFVIKQKSLIPFKNISNPKQNKSMFISALFIQKQCIDYNCSSLQILQDFFMKNRSSIPRLNSFNMVRGNQFILTADNSLLSIYQYQNILNKQTIQIFSSPIISKDQISSIAIRTRFSKVSSQQQGQTQVLMLFHSLSTDFMVRFTFIIILLVEYNQLIALLYHSDLKSFKYFLMIGLFYGCFSDISILVSSVISIFIFSYTAHNTKLGFLVSSLYLALYFAYQVQIMQIMYLVAFTIIHLLSYLLKLQRITEISVEKYITFVFWSMLPLYGSFMQWNFIIFLSPVYYLTVLSISQKDGQAIKKKLSYNLMAFDEEQDVLSKISRQLQNR